MPLTRCVLSVQGLTLAESGLPVISHSYDIIMSSSFEPAF